jgi:hypothetical protein
MAGFVQLLNRERGATAETIRRYRQEASRWISSLGPNPKHFDAKAIREATPDKGGHKANAIGLIQQAMGEVQAGIDFAAQHFGD